MPFIRVVSRCHKPRVIKSSLKPLSYTSRGIVMLSAVCVRRESIKIYIYTVSVRLMI